MQCDGQSAPYADAGVSVSNSTNISFTNCTISNAGGYGLWIFNGSLRVSFVRGSIFGTGAGGVRIGSDGSVNDSNDILTAFNTIANNHITFGGRVNPAGCGILVQQSSFNNISHNLVFDFYCNLNCFCNVSLLFFAHHCNLLDTGISVGWNWEYSDGIHAQGNVIDSNRIDLIGSLDQLSDLG
jgi:hypothetical protein